MQACSSHLSTPPSSKDRVFHTLDALRGIAAIGVVVFHFGKFFSPFQVPGGYLAVDLFFIMSGFVIARAYDRRFEDGMTAAQFMRVRMIRLYPLYALGTLLGLAAAIASMNGNNLDGWDFRSISIATFLAIFLIPNFYGRPNDRMFPLDAPCWSLFLELLVNMAFGMLWSRLKSKQLVLICIASAAGVLAAILHFGNSDQGYALGTLAPGIARTIFGFSVGILIARHLAIAPRRQSTPLFLLICSTVAVALTGSAHGTSREIWDAACVFLVFPAVVFCGTIVDPPSWLRGTSTFLGLTSYAIYVIHGPLSTATNSVVRHIFQGHPERGTPYIGICLAVLLLLTSWLVDRYLDNPIRRVLSSKLRFRSKGTARV